MAKVDCLTLDGVEVLFHSNDHMEPHFHVHRTDEWDIRVFFQQCTERKLAFEYRWRARSRSPSSRMIHRLLRQICEKQDQLLIEWELKVCR